MAIIGHDTPVNDFTHDLAFLKSRGVEKFVHFTLAENVASILKNGICPRSLLDSKGIGYSYTDNLRLEGTSVVNLSITNPNIKMFYGKRKGFPGQLFCVLLIDPLALANASVPYSYRSTNAASRQAQSCSVEELFGGNRPSFFEQNWPTDNQAEVLVAGTIHPAYIRAIQFPAAYRDKVQGVEYANSLAALIGDRGLNCSVEFCDQNFDYNKSVLGMLEPKQRYEHYFGSWNATESDSVHAEEAIRDIEFSTDFDCVAVRLEKLGGAASLDRKKEAQFPAWSLHYFASGSPYPRDDKTLSALAVIEKIINRGRVTILSEWLESRCSSDDEIAFAHELQCSLIELIKHQALSPHSSVSASCKALGKRAGDVGRSALDDLKRLSAAVCSLYDCPFVFEGIELTASDRNADYVIRFNKANGSMPRDEAWISRGSPVGEPIGFDFIRVNKPVEVNVDEDAIVFLLDYIFRFKSFREGQFDAIRRGLRRQDSIVLLPTGSGKSIVFQLLSLITPGIAIVVCPIISLIEDQVDNLFARGIDRVVGISSSTPMEDTLKGVTSGQFLMNYVSPERFQNRKFNNSVRHYASTNIVSVVAIDEAHCVSEWGHDFRTAYLGLADTCRNVCSTEDAVPPLIALTGTASMSVLKDMKRDLGITDDFAVIEPSTFDRPEIHYRVIRAGSFEKMNALERVILEEIPGDFGSSFDEFYEVTGADDANCGIIFCQHVNGSFGIMSSPGSSKRGVFDQVEHLLPRHCAYYSGSSPKRLSKTDWEKNKRQQALLYKSNLRSVMVSTSAFGMGIDKPNVRWVVHFGIPSSLESYYQQVGRAARDRNIAYAYLLLSDDFPSLNTEILDPSKTPVENIQSKEKEKGAWADDDVSRTLFFHTLSFSGAADELATASDLLDACNSANYKDQCWRLPFDSASKNGMERAIYRYRILGVFEGYEIDYSGFGFGEFVISPTKMNGEVLRARMEDGFLSYVSAYQSDEAYVSAAKTSFEKAVSGAVSDRDYIKAAMKHLLQEFTYKVLEEGRRRASFTMLSTARSAANMDSPEEADSEFRSRLLAYLSLDGQDGGSGLRSVINRATDVQLLVNVIVEYEKREGGLSMLLGQSSRLLEDYPQHYGLHFIQAVSCLLAREYEAMESALKTSVSFGIKNYGLSTEKCLDNWAILLNRLTPTGMSAERLDGLLPVFCDVFDIDRARFLKKLTTAQARMLAFVDRAYSLVSVIEEDLGWISKN